jgi:hypothetical protein
MNDGTAGARSPARLRALGRRVRAERNMHFRAAFSERGHAPLRPIREAVVGGPLRRAPA